VTAYPAWTPASRPGIIPLHPLGFGTILGRSFAALRQNPRVLLGFALVVQTVGTLIATAGIVTITIATFVRLDTLEPGTEDFSTVMAGSIAITAAAGVVLGLAATSLGVLVQGIVVSEVAHAAVAEKLTLGALWRRVKPVAWRLIGYTVLVTLAVLVAVGIVAAGVVALVIASEIAGIIVGILLVIGAIPLTLWLTTKLLIVPAAIILERASIFGAIGRSWSLTRGRFWPTLGIVVIVSAVFGTISQVVGIPFSFLSVGLTTVLTPTGEPNAGALIGILVGGLLTQIVTLLVQSIALIVQSTMATLVYIDCRMRREGLDLDLLNYVERRDAGASDLPDPYSLHVGRVIAPRPPSPPYGLPQAYGAPQGYGSPQAYGYPAPAYGTPAPSGVTPYAAGAAGPAGAATPVPVAAPAPQPASGSDPASAAPRATAEPTTPTRWAAPGAAAEPE
jgi:hypothetical protein